MSISEELHNEFEDSVDVANQDEVQKQDFSQFTKSELVDFLEQFKPEANFQEANSILKNVRQQYEHIFEQEEQAALEKFVEDGSLADDFKYKKDELSLAFDNAFTSVKEKITAHYSSLEKQKTKNLEIKNSILEQMRVIIASEESAESFQSFKKLQESWKATGQVPLSEAKELWANYQALTDMFYNNRSV